MMDQNHFTVWMEEMFEVEYKRFVAIPSGSDSTVCCENWKRFMLPNTLLNGSS